MKNIHISGYPYIAVCFLLVTAMSCFGTIHSQNIHSPNAGKAILNVNADTNIQNRNSKDIGIPARNFFAIVVDSSNNKWFLTELGIISFTGEIWKLHNENSKLASKDVKDFAYENSSDGSHLWIATTNGVTIASFPFDTTTGANSFNIENSTLPSNNVIKIAIGNNSLRWFGTDRGISAYGFNKWLRPSYKLAYPERMFKSYPITSMATNRNGDSLYIGTDGAGIARVFRNDVDGISGASVYAIWGPINLPSDKIYSIFIASDGTKWFGTDQGIARHTGKNTLENWTVFTTDDGLVNNFVQAITADTKGSLWFGTKGGGISVFDGTKWISYSKENGLNSNNILCIAVDREGLVWIGTDDGVTCYNNGKFINFK
jgi:ligand-binding sensor domain-containing protein